MHDVCLQKLPVVFAVDRAGLVGADGETHQGIFDLSYLRLMPSMTVMAPKNARELQEMLRFALAFSGPICLRYPRGVAYQGFSEQQEEIFLGKAELLKKGEGIALVALGSMVSTGAHIEEKMEKKSQNLTLVNARFAKPIDTEILDRLVEEGHHTIITLEENVRNGGFGEAVLEYMNARHPEIRVEIVALPDAYVEHGSVSALREILGIDSDSIIRSMQEKGIFKE